MRIVNREECINGFDLDQQALRNDEIGAVSAVELDAFVFDRERLLAFERSCA